MFSNKVRDDKKAHFQQCSGLTAQAAEMAARLVLEKRPEWVDRVNHAFLNKRQSVFGGTRLRLGVSVFAYQSTGLHPGSSFDEFLLEAVKKAQYAG